MHIIQGGNHKGREYGCMFTPWEQYSYPTSSGLHYAQWGLDDKSDEPAMLFFRVIDNKLVHAEPLGEFGPFDNMEEENAATKAKVDEIVSRNAFLSEHGVRSEFSQIEREDISYYAETHEDESDIKKITSHLYKVSIPPSLAELIGLYPDWEKSKTVFDRPAVYFEYLPNGDFKDILICTGPHSLESLSKNVFSNFADMFEMRIDDILEELGMETR